MKMDQAGLLGTLRHIISGAGAVIVALGWTTSAQWQTVNGALIAPGGTWQMAMGAVVFLIPVIWSNVQKMQQSAAVHEAAKTGIAAPATFASPISSTPSPLATHPAVVAALQNAVAGIPVTSTRFAGAPIPAKVASKP